jgi:predicted outer membrane repeat protein
LSCDEKTYDCTLEIAGSNVFSSNSAGESGGAIYWGDVEPILSPGSKYVGNQALIYANDIGSIPAMMV